MTTKYISFSNADGNSVLAEVIDNKQSSLSSGVLLQAARDGRNINKFVCSTTVTTVATVSTSSTIYYDVPLGKRVLVTGVCYGLRSASDSMHVYPVSCTAVAGGGAATQLGHCHTVDTGAAKAGREQYHEEFNPPMCANYSDGVRSVSMAAYANDSSAILLYAWHGFVEDE